MFVIKSSISGSKFSRIGGIYRQDRGAEYKASPPGRAMSPDGYESPRYSLYSSIPLSL